MNVSFHDIKVFIEVQCCCCGNDRPMVELPREEQTIRKFVALSFRDKCWGGKRAVCIAFQTSILFILWKWSELHVRERKAEERVGWVLAASHPPFNSPLGWGRPCAPRPFQVPGWLQYLPPFVTLQLLMKWISFSSWKWSVAVRELSIGKQAGFSGESKLDFSEREHIFLQQEDVQLDRILWWRLYLAYFSRKFLCIILITFSLSVSLNLCTFYLKGSSSNRSYLS